MKFKTAIAALFALVLGATSAQAAPSVAAYSVPNVTTFKANNLASKLKITVEGYVAAGDGGKADYQYSAVDCTERPGKCLHDGAGNAFTRTDPSEHLAAWGFVSGGAYDWATHGVSSADASPVIMAAQAENATKGIATTNCDGAQIYLATDLVLAGGGLKFTCGVMPGVTTDNAGYLNLPGTIRKAHGVRIHRAADGTEFYGAFILPYHYTSAPTTAQQGSVLIQKTIDDADTGVECDQKSCIDHDLTILGFDTGYEAFQSPNSVWNNITVDANVCFWIQKVGGNTNNQNFNCGPYLTRSIDPTKKNQVFDISKIENDGGLCKVTVTPHSVTDDVADIQYASWIFIARVNSTSASCNGRWKISNLVVGSGTASFDLVGSAVVGPSAYSHWATGSSIIYTSNIGNVGPGNVITGFAANGIPNGTTVSYVWPLPVHPSGYTTTTGSANAYVATEGSVAPCRLADSLNEYLTPNFTNTGAATLNIALNVACGGGTSGAIPVHRADDSALQANDIISGTNILLVLKSDASAWLLQQAKIILSTPTTLAQTANVLVGYTNAICSSCGTNARAEFTEGARIDAGGSQGGIAAGGAGNATGVMVGGPVAKGFGDTDKVAGFTCTDCTVFDHSVYGHVQNSNNTKFADWRTDSEGSTDNDEQYLMLVDGQSNSMQLTGVKSAKAGIGFLVNIAYPNNPDKACATWNDAHIASSAGTFPIMDVEQGCMRSSNGQSGGSGINLISNLAAEARFDVYMPNATNIYEGAAARAVSCTTGSTLAGGYNCPTVSSIPTVLNVAALQAGHFHNAQALALEGYYAAGDHAGGMLHVDSTCVVDNGLCFQDADGVKYYRDDPAPNGELPLIFFGAKPDWSTAMMTPFNAASAAAVAMNIHTISFEGNATGSGFKIGVGSFVVPQGVKINCHGGAYVQPSTGDFRNYPHAIMVTSASGVQLSAGAGLMGNCIVIQNALATSTPPTTQQDAYTRTAAFTGNGVQIIGDGATVDGGAIIGFTQLITPSNVKGYIVTNVIGDGTNCWLAKQASEGLVVRFENLDCKPLASISGPRLAGINLSSIADNGAGELRATFASSCSTADCPLNGYRVWITNPASAQSAQGGWITENCTTARCDLVGSSSAYLAGATVNATIVSGLKTVTTTSALSTQVKRTMPVSGACIPANTVVNYVNVVYKQIFLNNAPTCGATEDLTIADASGNLAIDVATIAAAGTGYAVGENLTVSGGTTVAGPALLQVDTVDGSGVILTFHIVDGGDYSALPASPAATTSDGSGTGATFNVSSSSQLTLNSLNRTGDCFTILKSNAVQITNVHCNQHATGFNAGINSGRVTVENFKADDNANIQDDSHICILAGASSGKIGFNNYQCYNYAGHGVVDQGVSAASSAGNSYTQGHMSYNNSSGFNRSALEVVSATPGTAKRKGTVFANNWTDVSTGIFISADANNGVTMSGNNMRVTTLYCQTPAAFLNVYDSANNFASGSQCPMIPSVSGTGTPTIATGSTDKSGEVTGGTSATSIVVAFAATWASTPFCRVTPQTQVAAWSWTVSTTAITITQTATSGQKVDWSCSTVP